MAAAASALDSRYTALLVIDMQRDFCEPGGYAATAGADVRLLRAPIGNIRRLLDAARETGAMVVFTREGHRADLSDCPPTKRRRSAVAGAPIGASGPLGRLLIRGERGHDIIDELAPTGGEPVVDKPGYCAFFQTDLELLLKTRGIRQVIFTGVTTEVCVSSTLRGAVERGFDCLVVGDACASGNMDLHRAALAMVEVEGGLFGRVATTAEVCDALRAPRSAAKPSDSTP
jgi:nicotinamidase-related amidase